MSKLSVLVPVCNVETYLEQCLESLIKQSFAEIEIICVDDGSTDGSGQILDRYADLDSRIKVMHKENTGYGNSMNVAMDLAEGDYIAILESDDFAEPDMLQKLYETAISQDVEVVKGDYYHYLDGCDTFVNRLRNYSKNKLLNVVSCPDILNLADSIWSCLYKRSFLLNYNIRFHETPGASYQDISFALQVWLQAQKVYFIEDPILHYRRDNPNSSMNNPRKLFCVFDEYEWVENKLSEILSSSLTLQQYFAASKYRDYFNHYHRVGVQYQYALLLRLEQSFRKDKEKSWIQKRSFLPAVWGELCDMETDINIFFNRTAKFVADSRLDSCDIENDYIYANAFFKALTRYPQILIYGAGQIGQHLAKGILKYGGKVEAFVVTRIADSGVACMGIPVIELRDATGIADTCAVIIAVAEWKQYELYTNLVSFGFQHIFRVDTVVKERF